MYTAAESSYSSLQLQQCIHLHFRTTYRSAPAGEVDISLELSYSVWQYPVYPLYYVFLARAQPWSEICGICMLRSLRR